MSSHPAVVHVRMSEEEVEALLANLPRLASGAAPGGGSAAQAILVRIGSVVLRRIQLAFVVKSHGGTDESGLRWKPLNPKTIAYTRRHPILSGKGTATKKWVPKAAARAEFRPSWMLTKRQRARWWALYKRGLARYKGDKAHAAAVAWIILKEEGAQTLLSTYGHGQADILNSTGLLLTSLTPGIAPDAASFRPPKQPLQIFDIAPGTVVVGTLRKGAVAHHYGVPGKLPQRRLWPEPARWPSSWWTNILESATLGVIDLVLYLLNKR